MVQERDDRSLLDGVGWRNRTRQQEGRITEAKVLKRRGALIHPNSGAGHIKDDGHDDEHVYEIKDARKQYTLKSDELLAVHKRAIRQGRTGVFVVEFTDGSGITAEIHITNRRHT